MRAQLDRFISALVLVVATLCWSGVPASAADGDPWKISKSSGEVWVTRGETQRVALTPDTALSAGDTIRTGRSGRVLLTRGEESIVVSPNTEIGIPAQSKDGFPTTIAQKAGSILLEVEKRNVQHFEVETPYLAAVVKGTQFRVTVDRRGAHVDVTRGQVQVSDFKSGQNVLVLPGQSAAVSANGVGGLQLKGSGTFNAIEQGKPRATGLRALSIPKGGLHAPRLGAKDNAIKQSLHGPAAKSFARADAGKDHGVQRTAHGGIRISAPLGEVNLDFRKVTHGLAHAPGESATASRGGDNASDSRKSSGDAAANGSGDSGTSSSASSNSSSSSGTGGSASVASASAGPVGGSVGGTVSGLGGAVGGTVSGVTSAVGSTVGGVTSTVGGTVNGVTSTLGSTVGGVTSTVGSTVSGVTSTVGGLVGGLLGGKKK